MIIVGLKGDESCQSEVSNIFDSLDVNVSVEDFTLKVLPSQKPFKPILVTFKDQTLRDRIMGKRKLTRLDTEVCRIASETKRNIYINPDLQKHTRDLFLKANQLKSHGFKYVWCKEEKILARKNGDDPVIAIITAAQVEALKTN